MTKMVLSRKLKAALITLTVVATMAGTLCACGNKAEVPMPSQTSTIDTIISPTTSVVTEATKKAKVKTGAHSYELNYQKGDVSWTANVAYDITEKLSFFTDGWLLKAPKDFTIKEAFVDEKERYVIVCGNVDSGVSYSKLALLDINTGKELAGYWLKHERVNDFEILYDVPSENEVADYLVLVGETSFNPVLQAAMNHGENSITRVPLVHVMELGDSGAADISFNPVAYSNGTALSVKPVRADGEIPIVAIGYRTRVHPQGTISPIVFTDLLKLKDGTFLFDRSGAYEQK